MATAHLPTLAFGRTGHQSTRLIFGAAGVGGNNQDRADLVLAQVLAVGINHIDTAASYGESELRLAPWLKKHRSDVFLATKTGHRSGDDARAELERSLTRLGVDSVDLIQLHNLVEDDEWDVAFAPNGAVASLEKAKDEGLVRNLGVTGHGLRIPRMHLRSLERYPFASVLFPWNYSLANLDSYRRDVDDLASVCTANGVAMQTIKSVAKGRWAAKPERQFSWYEPLNDGGAISRAVRFVLGTPNVFLNTSSDTRTLGAIVAAASSPDALLRPTDADLAADASTFGVTALFDGADLERI